MSTVVFDSSSVSPTKRPAVARPSGAKALKGDRGPRGPRGPRGAAGKDSTVPGPRGPAGPGAGRPNAVARLNVTYAMRNGVAVFSGATVQSVAALDGTSHPIGSVFDKDSWSESDAPALKFNGFVQLYVMNDRGGMWVDAVQIPVDSVVYFLGRVPAYMLPSKKSGTLSIMMFLFEDE